MPRTRTTLTPALTTRIVGLVRAGNYIETAAKAAGIHKSTYYSWMRRGEEAAEAESRDEPISESEAAFAEIYRQVSQAEGQAEADALAAVREADRGWQAHMTYLEHRFADRWRQQSGVRHVKSEERTESLEQMVDRLHCEQGHPTAT
jgi:transposase